VRRPLADGYELDDDLSRVDVAALHAALQGTYWAAGRPLAEVERLVRGATRVVGLYHDGALAGYARCVSDGTSFAYLADVIVFAEHRGRGLGVELVREIVEGGAQAGLRWLLHTADAHDLYAKFGFGTPDASTMERPALRGDDA